MLVGDQQNDDEGVTDYASNGDDLPAYKGVELTGNTGFNAMILLSLFSKHHRSNPEGFTWEWLSI